jgi:hypothetical protein
MRDSLLTTTEAAEILGITDSQFRRLATRLDLKPGGTYPHPAYGNQCYLWQTEPVRALIGGSEVLAIQQGPLNRAKARARNAEERRHSLARRYPSWRDSLPDAAEAMFNLNRYAKWRRCLPTHRQEIYGLKKHFLELLCCGGYAREVKLHSTERQGLPCYHCSCEDECDYCYGTGWYRCPETLEFVAFRFDVAGRVYAWHQPRELVTWPFTLTEVNEPWELQRDEKPIHITPREFANAKELIRYTVDKYCEVSSEPVTVA